MHIYSLWGSREFWRIKPCMAVQRKNGLKKNGKTLTRKKRKKRKKSGRIWERKKVKKERRKRRKNNYSRVQAF